MEASILNDERPVHQITTKTVNLTIAEKDTLKEVDEEEIPKLVDPAKGSDAELDKNSQKYRLAMIEKALSEVRSMRTYTSASTIAPEVVKQQVKKNLELRQKKMDRKRAIAKGEASAVTRSRRDNKETIRESHGLWGWDE